MINYEVPLKRIIELFNLETIVMPDGAQDSFVNSCDLNRPGLQLTGFFDYFDNHRIQLMGKVEFTYLSSMSEERRRDCFCKLFSHKMPAVIVTRGLYIWDEMRELAARHGVPLLRTSEHTSRFMADLISFLNYELAQRITRHGVLVEVYGEGVLLMGESGVGKSETAMELVKRGHRLIADDAVEIKRINESTIEGTSPEIIRHFIELRGVGIVDVKNIFGMGAVKDSQTIDLVIKMEIWDNAKNYERLGLSEKYVEILGVDVPMLLVPVRPGRNLAIIIEVAAMNNRQKKMGYNAAQALADRAMLHTAGGIEGGAEEVAGQQ